MKYLKDPQYKAAPNVVDDRKAEFDKVNRIVIEGGGWLISTPGKATVLLECLPGSQLPNALADRGYDLRHEEPGERILAHSVREVFTRNSDGSLSILSPGSTQPVATIVTHPGPTRTRRFSFQLP